MPRIFPEHGDETGSDVHGDVADLISEAARRIRAESKSALGSRGVTWAQMRALRACSHGNGPIRMSELAARLGIARRSATAVVDELESRRLVVRSDDPADRRAVVVTTTDAGRALLADLHTARRAAAVGFTAASGLSLAELTTLRDLLARLAGVR